MKNQAGIVNFCSQFSFDYIFCLFFIFIVTFLEYDK